MYSLILTICMLPVNAQGEAIGNDVCEEAYISQRHKTKEICVKQMEKHTKAIKNSIVDNFDWTLYCEKEI